MREPSGEKTGCASNFGRPVNARTAPEATSIKRTREPSKSPECGVSSRVKAIDLPSGDQERGEAGGPGGKLGGRLQEPDVRRRAGAPPSDGTSQTCVRRGAAWIRKPSFPIYNGRLS